ncbi:unnamed protein product [Macrosiphum euphorbiae]|uniref:Secreted protein n=1 Tax=Macrosiphum euphorbiae TaxID=13131 RepID=A0AAV0YA60_9HEMI|nr:unnamed protein product [Macrosiphum euphorbiae]
MPGLGLCPALSPLLWTPRDSSDISGERSVIGVSPTVSSPLHAVRRSASCREVTVPAAFSQPSWQSSYYCYLRELACRRRSITHAILACPSALAVCAFCSVSCPSLHTQIAFCSRPCQNLIVS